ncbi:MAG: gamma-glutamyltransferase, partial [Gammaproteobacteria bacterium]
PRYHHQYLPDQVQFELGGLSLDEQQGLQAKGHVLHERSRQYGNMQAVMLWKQKNFIFAASDPRGEGEAQVIRLSR